MKFRGIFALLVLVVLLLTACQAAPAPAPATQAPASSNSYPAPAQENQAAQPAQATALPQPTIVVPGSSTTLYPDPKSGDIVSWPQAEAMILNGEVTKITQADPLQVTLDLKDGRSLISNEPAKDDVLKVVQNCGDPCKDINVVK